MSFAYDYIKLLNASFYLGPNISSGFTHLSKSSDVRYWSLSAASFKVDPSLCAVLAILAALEEKKKH